MSETVLAAIAAPLATVIVLLISKVYDRRISRERQVTLTGDHLLDTLIRRIEQLEEGRDRLLAEKLECLNQVRALENHVTELERRIDELVAAQRAALADAED